MSRQVMAAMGWAMGEIWLETGLCTLVDRQYVDGND
jgi:hypothetical protein